MVISPAQFRRRRLNVPVANQILRVMHDVPVNRLLVYVSGGLVDLTLSQAMQAYASGWRLSTGGNFDGLPKVIVSFGVNISTANQWRIVNPGAWVFEDGRPLMPPFEGAIG